MNQKFKTTISLNIEEMELMKFTFQKKDYLEIFFLK